MQIRADQLEPHLQRQLAPLYVVHGDEPLLSLEAADAIRARARAAGHTDRTVLQAERAFKWSELAASGASLSLFGEKTLIELRIPTGKPGAEGGSAIEAYCARLSPDVLTLVTLPRLDRASQSSAWFQALDARGVVINVYPVERARLPAWIGARLARQKQKADAPTLQFLADSVEGNLLAAHQEVEKLALLAPPGELDFETVREAVLNVARYDVQRLPEAMFSGEGARYARVLEGLRGEGEAAPRIVWVLAEEIRAAAQVQDALAAGRPAKDALRDARVWGDARQAAVVRAARELARPALHDALARCARIDRIAKGVAEGDAWDELLALGMRLVRLAPERARSAARVE